MVSFLNFLSPEDEEDRGLLGLLKADPETGKGGLLNFLQSPTGAGLIGALGSYIGAATKRSLNPADIQNPFAAALSGFGEGAATAREAQAKEAEAQSNAAYRQAQIAKAQSEIEKDKKASGFYERMAEQGSGAGQRPGTSPQGNSLRQQAWQIMEFDPALAREMLTEAEEWDRKSLERGWKVSDTESTWGREDRLRIEAQGREDYQKSVEKFNAKVESDKAFFQTNGYWPEGGGPTTWTPPAPPSPSSTGGTGGTGGSTTPAPTPGTPLGRFITPEEYLPHVDRQESASRYDAHHKDDGGPGLDSWGRYQFQESTLDTLGATPEEKAIIKRGVIDPNDPETRRVQDKYYRLNFERNRDILAKKGIITPDMPFEQQVAIINRSWTHGPGGVPRGFGAGSTEPVITSEALPAPGSGERPVGTTGAVIGSPQPTPVPGQQPTPTPTPVPIPTEPQVVPPQSTTSPQVPQALPEIPYQITPSVIGEGQRLNTQPGQVNQIGFRNPMFAGEGMRKTEEERGAALKVSPDRSQLATLQDVEDALAAGAITGPGAVSAARFTDIKERLAKHGIHDFDITDEDARQRNLLKVIDVANKTLTLDTLKATYGGSPTEGERQFLSEIKISPEDPPAVIQYKLNRAKNYLEWKNKRAENIQALSAQGVPLSYLPSYDEQWQEKHPYDFRNDFQSITAETAVTKPQSKQQIITVRSMEDWNKVAVGDAYFDENGVKRIRRQ